MVLSEIGIYTLSLMELGDSLWPFQAASYIYSVSDMAQGSGTAGNMVRQRVGFSGLICLTVFCLDLFRGKICCSLIDIAFLVNKMPNELEQVCLTTYETSNLKDIKENHKSKDPGGNRRTSRCAMKGIISLYVQ